MIGFCTMFADNYAPIAEITRPLMSEYCNRHGYAFFEIRLGDGNAYPFKKHKYIKRLFQSADIQAMFYLDIDAVITNQTIKIEDFIDDKNDLFITKDVTEINGGSLILKNTEEGKWVNDRILEQEGRFENEQNAMVWLMGSPQFNQYVKILPQQTINAYKYEIYPEIGKLTAEQGQWNPGCFILHTPGASFETRISTLKNTPIIR